ncbi:MAG: hypothetical protein HQL26_05490 [Candidatus Omnitrophica bacterium]|nr:hypothetical protein [Candidatus Omnitrophota bacterium]
MKKLLLFTSLLFLTGCSLYNVTSEDTTTNFYPSKKSAADVTYLTTVDRAYDVIGTVRVNTERRQKISEVIDRMKYEASILGGDAIINVKVTSPYKWNPNGYIRGIFTADVIVFKDKENK